MAALEMHNGQIYFQYWALLFSYVGWVAGGVLIIWLKDQIKPHFYPKIEEEQNEYKESVHDEEEESVDDDESEVTSEYSESKQSSEEITPRRSLTPVEYRLQFDAIGDGVEDYMNELVDKLMRVRGFKQKVIDKELQITAKDQGAVAMIIGHDRPDDDLMDDPAIRKVMNILKNESRIHNINVNDENQDEESLPDKKELQEMLELTFKTKNDDIENYHEQLMHVIMNIPGFAEKVHEKNVEVISENKGKMRFLLRQSVETAMDDPAIQAVLELLQAEGCVKGLNLDQSESIPTGAAQPVVQFEDESDSKEDVQDDGEWEELVELGFKTEGEVIQVYHEELLKKVMDVPGFYDLVHDYNVEIISDDKGKMNFVLKVSADTAMSHPAIKYVLDILQNERRVNGINVDDTIANLHVPKKGWAIIKEALHHKPQLTQAILISFTAKSENVKVFADELMKECVKIKYFEYKMYEKKITIVRENKAKFQFIMYHSGESAMEDPDMIQAMAVLEAQEEISKLKVETIPYFLEA